MNHISASATLNNGVKIPYLGLGTYLLEDGKEVIDTVNFALEQGYRHIDTATLYANEKGVGKAVRESSVPREEIFVTTKVWNDAQRRDDVRRAFDHNMKLLGLDYVDLYLIHWPVKGKYVQTWKVLEELYESDRIRAIGVCNFMPHHLKDLLEHTAIIPAVNQVEFHPYLIQPELLNLCKQHNIQYEAWSPIMKGKVLQIDLLKEIAAKYGKSPVQLILRWDLQKGVVTIPKSSKPQRIISNAQIFDFEISEEDMKRIDTLDRGERLGPDPNNFTF